MNKNKRSNNSGANVRKSGNKGYQIAIVAIFAIIISHFLLQFSSIQDENVRVPEELVKTEKFDQSNQITEKNDFPKIIESESATAEIESVVNADDQPAPKAQVQNKSKKYIKVIKKNQFKSSPARTQTKNAKSPKFTKERAPQPETRAERLRRAEKILTGV